MTAPRAVGVRISYADVPTTVTRWVEETLGSAVVSYADQVGGMSPGCAARLVCADGARAFVKAVGAGLNPHTPVLFRREVAALELIGERTPGGAEGAGGTYDSGLTDQHYIFQQFTNVLETLADHLDAPVPAWVRADAPAWAARTRALSEEPMNTLVHYDIRIDNLLQRRPTGEIVFLDWGAAGIGPDWLDPLLARLERVDQDWFDASLASSAALARAGDEAVTTWLVGIGTHLAVRSVTAVDVNLPTLQEFRRTESARFLGAAARRHL